MKATSALVSFLILVPSALAQTFTVDQVLAKMDANSRVFQSLQAAIQRIDTDFLSSTIKTYKPDVSSGKLYVESRNSNLRFRMEIDEPKELAQSVLIDMGLLQIYDHRAKNVMERKVGDKDETLQLSVMGFGVSSDKIKKSYKVDVGGQENLEGKPVTVLVLAANQPDSRFPKIRLWISQQTWNAVQAELTEGNKNTHVVKYKDVKLNQAVPASVFRLILPKDVTRG